MLNQFGPMFAAAIRKRRVHHRSYNHFHQGRHLTRRSIFNQNRSVAVAEWRQLAEPYAGNPVLHMRRAGSGPTSHWFRVLTVETSRPPALRLKTRRSSGDLPLI